MMLVIAGGSGLIGRALAQHALAEGHGVRVLTRRATARLPAGVQRVEWDGLTPGPWSTAIDGADAVVNLSGESIGAKRWSAERKRVLLESRTQPTQALLAAVDASARPPPVFVQASGVGYHGAGNAPVTDASPPGNDFLAHLALDWEASAAAVAARSRLVIARLGVVLDAVEGAFPRLLAPVRLGIGGPLAGGRQWLSWIHVADAAAALLHAVTTRSLSGAVLCTAPNPITNADAVRVLARLLDRRAWLPTPRLALELLLGEMATLVCDGQRAAPEKLLANGFRFRYPSFAEAAAALLTRAA